MLKFYRHTVKGLMIIPMEPRLASWQKLTQNTVSLRLPFGHRTSTCMSAWENGARTSVEGVVVHQFEVWTRIS